MINKKDKRGISPLIATVLIIGFTIVLAALVITWGSDLFKSTVAETETTSKFSLACTTGLRLDAEADKNTDTATQINLTLRNNNQDRPIDNFRFVLHMTGTSPIDLSLPSPAPGSSSSVGYAAWTGSAFSGTAGNLALAFPVPKIYRLTATASGTPALNTALTKIDVYPIFTIDGTTKACENPVELDLV